MKCEPVIINKGETDALTEGRRWKRVSAIDVSPGEIYRHHAKAIEAIKTVGGSFHKQQMGAIETAVDSLRRQRVGAINSITDGLRGQRGALDALTDELCMRGATAIETFSHGVCQQGAKTMIALLAGTTKSQIDSFINSSAMDTCATITKNQVDSIVGKGAMAIVTSAAQSHFDSLIGGNAMDTLADITRNQVDSIGKGAMVAATSAIRSQFDSPINSDVMDTLAGITRNRVNSIIGEGVTAVAASVGRSQMDSLIGRGARDMFADITKNTDSAIGKVALATFGGETFKHLDSLIGKGTLAEITSRIREQDAKTIKAFNDKMAMEAFEALNNGFHEQMELDVEQKAESLETVSREGDETPEMIHQETTKALEITPQRKSPKLIRKVPGSNWLWFADFFFSPKTVENVFMPSIADWHHEYFEALKEGRTKKARMVCIRHHWGLLKTILFDILWGAISRVISVVKK